MPNDVRMNDEYGACGFSNSHNKNEMKNAIFLKLKNYDYLAIAKWKGYYGIYQSHTIPLSTVQWEPSTHKPIAKFDIVVLQRLKHEGCPSSSLTKHFAGSRIWNVVHDFFFLSFFLFIFSVCCFCVSLLCSLSLPLHKYMQHPIANPSSRLARCEWAKSHFDAISFLFLRRD